MAERPTYKRRGAQLRLPAFQDVMSQVAARGANETAQAINGMAQFVAQQTQNYAQIKGEEYGALHAPTRKQIEDAYMSGDVVDMPGGNLTVFDRAVKAAALDAASNQLELLTREKISGIVLAAYQTQPSADKLSDDIDAVITGYAGTFDRDAPSTALKFRAKMGIYANNEFESYSKWKIAQNKTSGLASLYGSHVQLDADKRPKDLLLNTVVE
mgnify:CR=1 FL=1